MHSVVYEHVSPHLSDSQSEIRSVMSNLMASADYLSESLDDNVRVDAVYTDFDRLNIDILISKLEFHGICGDILRWFESYLKGRKQCVRFGGCTSEEVTPPSGIPQGSLLGPLLFIVYANDPDSISSRNLGYADDFTIFRRICSIEVSRSNPSCLSLLNGLREMILI